MKVSNSNKEKARTVISKTFIATNYLYPKKGLSLCPGLLLHDLKVPGMSCLTGVSLFA